MTEDDRRRDGQPFGQMSVWILGRPRVTNAAPTGHDRNSLDDG